MHISETWDLLIIYNIINFIMTWWHLGLSLTSIRMNVFIQFFLWWSFHTWPFKRFLILLFLSSQNLLHFWTQERICRTNLTTKQRIVFANQFLILFFATYTIEFLFKLFFLVPDKILSCIL